MDADLVIAEAVGARVTETHVVVVLSDGREIATPLAWYPALVAASPDVRARFEITPFGVHWPDLDEDLSLEGMFRGSRVLDRSETPPLRTLR